MNDNYKKINENTLEQSIIDENSRSRKDDNAAIIKKIDHIVITVKDILLTSDFYRKLGFKVKESNGRYELYAGDFKINVHILGKELQPHAQIVQTGSADLCFEIGGSIEEYKRELESVNLDIELGIVKRNGVNGAMNSIYLRDPDGNLIEFCSYE